MSFCDGKHAIGLVEKDLSGDFLWLWIYPSLSSAVKENIQRNCNIIWDEDGKNDITSFYVQFNKQWIHLYSEFSESAGKICLAVVSSDFNPSLYLKLAQVFLQRYLSTGSPVPILEIYLEVLMRGHCTLDDCKTLNVKDFDVAQYVIKEAKLRDVISMFGVETILLFTAILLKKRIIVYHPNVSLLADICRSIVMLAYHRPPNWNALFPLVHLAGTEVEELRSVTGGFIAGFLDSSIDTRSEIYDLYVNAYSKEITVAAHARETFAMGKLHKDIATFMVQCVEDENQSNEQCIMEIARKTKDLLLNLETFGAEDESGRISISAETLREKRLPPATEKFLLNLASVEGLLRL